MGGIVAKKVRNIERESQVPADDEQSFLIAREDPSMRHLADRIHTIYFLATPHRGSDLAKILRNILRVTYGRKSYVDELLRDSRSIWSVNDSFRHYADDLQLWSFYETRNSNLAVKNAIVVDRNSATLGYAKERVWPLEADHRGICKFNDQSDPNYKILRNCFSKSIKEIEIAGNATVPSQRYRSLSFIVNEELAVAYKERRQNLARILAVAAPPVDELNSLTNIRMDGSCEWLTNMDSYVSWKTNVKPHRIFWLNGNAAMGKSVLSGQVITDLHKSSSRCSYFFFKHGDSLKSSVSACLRSIAYQMGCADEDVLKTLSNPELYEFSWDEMDEGSIWRRLFLGAIFKQADLSLHYWVIDALDECYKPSGFLTFLRRLPQNLKVFITSRQTAEIERFWPTIDPILFVHSIKEEDTLQDLKSFIDVKLVLPHDNEEMEMKLKTRILQKASGSFLWVALIIQELEQAYSVGVVEEILNEVPADMNKLYERILSRMPRSQRQANLAKSILTWTVLSLRSLTVMETQHFVNLDLQDTIFGLDKSIAAICGQLVRIDKSNRIKIMHQTTKTFLLQQRSHPEYAIEAMEGHTRLAEICLEFLTGSEFKEICRHRTMKSWNANAEQNVANYACIYFSDHLRKGSSEGSKFWSLLYRLFDNAVLSWVEYLASTGKTRHIARSAYNIRSFLSRDIKHLSHMLSKKQALEAWVADLIRISVKFRQNISTLPSAIYTLVPALCPSKSMIKKCYGGRFRGITISGHTDEDWDDCLVHVDYTAHEPTAVAYGNQMLAVALDDGNIVSYYWDSIQVRIQMVHDEIVSILTTSKCGRWLASGGLRRVRVWNTESGNLVRTFDTDHQTLAVSFNSEVSTLTAATCGNMVVTWNINDGLKQWQWQWIESIQRDSDWPVPHQPPNKLIFSPDRSVLIVSYRGYHTYLFDMDTKSCVGCFVREGNLRANDRRVSYCVDALAINPNPESDILVASYGDGEIVLYDIWSTKLRFRKVNVFAHYLACSSDGKYLVAASSQGLIQIFMFGGRDGEKLSLVYRIDGYEGDIQGITVSRHGFRVADIRENRCSIWEPPLLDPVSQEESSESDFNEAAAIDLRTNARPKRDHESEITVISFHPDGHILFCGMRNGTVACEENSSTISRKSLYSHGKNVTVITISFCQTSSLLISADESSHVYLYEVEVLGSDCKVVKMKKTMSLRQETRQPLESLLVKEGCDRFLTQRKSFAQVYTEQANVIGKPLQLNNDDGEPPEKSFTIMNHPLHVNYFLIIKYERICVYSWLDGSHVQNLTTGIMNPNFSITTSSLEQPLIEKATNLTLSHNQEGAEHRFIVDFFEVENSASQLNHKPRVLKVWKASRTSATDFSPLSLDSTILSQLASNIFQIIAVAGDFFLFLDVDLWVCSVDLDKLAKDPTCTSSRHFFLLTEWRFFNGQCLINYIPTTREFIIAKQSEILVVRRGLDYSQSWMPVDPLAANIIKRDTFDLNSSTGDEYLDF